MAKENQSLPILHALVYHVLVPTPDEKPPLSAVSRLLIWQALLLSTSAGTSLYHPVPQAQQEVEEVCDYSDFGSICCSVDWHYISQAAIDGTTWPGTCWTQTHHPCHSFLK